MSSTPPRHFEQRNIMPTAPLQDRAVNGALRFLKRQVSDAFYKHYALMPADTPAPERSDTAQRPRGRLSSSLRAAPRRRSPPSCSSTLFTRNEGVTCTYIYTPAGILTHRLLHLLRDHPPSFPTVLVGNQIADYACVVGCPSSWTGEYIFAGYATLPPASASFTYLLGLAAEQRR